MIFSINIPDEIYNQLTQDDQYNLKHNLLVHKTSRSICTSCKGVGITEHGSECYDCQGHGMLKTTEYKVNSGLSFGTVVTPAYPKALPKAT